MHSSWIGTGRVRDRKKWTMAHRATRKAVRAIENAWLQREAREAERGMNRGEGGII